MIPITYCHLNTMVPIIRQYLDDLCLSCLSIAAVTAALELGHCLYLSTGWLILLHIQLSLQPLWTRLLCTGWAEQSSGSWGELSTSQEVTSWKKWVLDLVTFLECPAFGVVVRAIHGCHIRIKWPAINAQCYINRKLFFSIKLQDICDFLLLKSDQSQVSYLPKTP